MGALVSLSYFADYPTIVSKILSKEETDNKKEQEIWNAFQKSMVAKQNKVFMEIQEEIKNSTIEEILIKMDELCSETIANDNASKSAIEKQLIAKKMMDVIVVGVCLSKKLLELAKNDPIEHEVIGIHARVIKYVFTTYNEFTQKN